MADILQNPAPVENAAFKAPEIGIQQAPPIEADALVLPTVTNLNATADRLTGQLFQPGIGAAELANTPVNPAGTIDRNLPPTGALINPAGTETTIVTPQQRAFNELQQNLGTIDQNATVDQVMQRMQAEHGWVNDEKTRQYIQGGLDEARARNQRPAAAETPSPKPETKQPEIAATPPPTAPETPTPTPAPEQKLPNNKTREQHEAELKKHYGRLVETGQLDQEAADLVVKQKLESYDDEFKKLNPETQTPEERTQELIDNIREGRGDILENMIELETVQRKLRGEPIDSSMRRALADLLQQQIETGNAENREVQTVLQKIAEMYGLEMQMARIPETYTELDRRADKIDIQITRKRNEAHLNNSLQSAKERQEVYNLYVELTQVEAQLANLMVMEAKFAVRYRKVVNDLDLTLGRKGFLSYAGTAMVNAGHRMTVRLGTPSLRSTRHQKYFGLV